MGEDASPFFGKSLVETGLVSEEYLGDLELIRFKGRKPLF